jgi:hypothetical protein
LNIPEEDYEKYAALLLKKAKKSHINNDNQTVSDIITHNEVTTQGISLVT